MKLTMDVLMEYIEVDGLSFSENDSMIGTNFCRMEHTNSDVIYDINSWLLDNFPNRYDDITQGKIDGSRPPKYYISVTLDDGAIHVDELEKRQKKEPKIKRIEDKAPTLKEMQEFVGGNIEVVYSKSGSQIIIDEEGKLKDKSTNWEATEEWLADKDGVTMADKGYHYDEYPDVIVGDAIILSGKAKLT